jgi:hypothetical protein
MNHAHFFIAPSMSSPSDSLAAVPLPTQVPDVSTVPSDGATSILGTKRARGNSAFVAIPTAVRAFDRSELLHRFYRAIAKAEGRYANGLRLHTMDSICAAIPHISPQDMTVFLQTMKANDPASYLRGAAMRAASAVVTARSDLFDMLLVDLDPTTGCKDVIAACDKPFAVGSHPYVRIFLAAFIEKAVSKYPTSLRTLVTWRLADDREWYMKAVHRGITIPRTATAYTTACLREALVRPEITDSSCLVACKIGVKYGADLDAKIYPIFCQGRLVEYRNIEQYATARQFHQTLAYAKERASVGSTAAIPM